MPSAKNQASKRAVMDSFIPAAQELEHLAEQIVSDQFSAKDRDRAREALGETISRLSRFMTAMVSEGARKVILENASTSMNTRQKERHPRQPE